MATLILRRAREISDLAPEDEAEAALVVIGHGTERSATSADTVHDLLEELRSRSSFRVVTAGFLDEEPRIEKVVGGLPSTKVVLVPFFAARGWHTTDSIPSALGLTGSVTAQAARTLWYAPPVGTLPEIADLVVEIVEDARASVELPSLPIGEPPPVRGARAFFFECLLEGRASGIRVLQVAVRPADSGFELRHQEDVDEPGDRLLGFSRPRDALDIARSTDEGAYRPLKTANNLRRGWKLGPLTPDGVWEAVALLYPAAVVHSWLERQGRLEIVDFQAWAERQSGQYAVVREIGPAEVSGLVGAVCGSCLRTRLWEAGGGVAGSVEAAAGPSQGKKLEGTEGIRVPCREPCAWFATRAKDSAPGKYK
jgi:sirohydrochlorin cobaltochelatase